MALEEGRADAVGAVEIVMTHRDNDKIGLIRNGLFEKVDDDIAVDGRGAEVEDLEIALRKETR